MFILLFHDVNGAKAKNFEVGFGATVTLNKINRFIFFQFRDVFKPKITIFAPLRTEINSIIRRISKGVVIVWINFFGK